MNTITVRCIYCDAKKNLTTEEARQLSGPPMCERDGGVMVAVAAKARARR